LAPIKTMSFEILKFLSETESFLPFSTKTFAEDREDFERKKHCAIEREVMREYRA
jgi:hypothetical protein